MGTHACTRIQNDNDYIEMHTRWDGFPQEIKESLNNLFNDWEATHAKLVETATVIDCSNYHEWIKDLGQFITQTKAMPTVESMSALFCMKSLVHHHVLPFSNKESKELNDYWGESNPDVVAIVKGNDITFNKKKKIKNAKENSIEDGFSIVRLQTLEAEGVFVDVKVKNFNEQEFLNTVFTLPQLWRNFHFSTRVKQSDYKNTTNIVHGYNNKFTQFYNTPKGYAVFSSKNINSKEDIIDNIMSIIPFDFYVNTLATHLFMRSPGNILPLTKGQQNHNIEPVATVEIYGNRLHLLAVEFASMPDLETKKDMLYKMVDYLKQNEQPFCEKYDIDLEYNELLLLQDKYKLALDYEKGLVKYFMTSIEQIDNKDCTKNDNAV